MRPHYLIRFDDLCPTMNWRTWAVVESLLVEHRVVPLLAVVPDNQDRNLMVAPADPQFWEQVRKWQGWGWTIGLHGYQHTYITAESGLVGIQPRSEFAGLTAEHQERKLLRAREIFCHERVEPQVWIAPAHSFDDNTIAGLKKIGVLAISDGFGLTPFVDGGGIFWVPQQLWRLRWRPFGVWTVCCHINSWGQEQLAAFARTLENYRPLITDFSQLKSRYCFRRQGSMDRVYASAHHAGRAARAQLQAVW